MSKVGIYHVLWSNVGRRSENIIARDTLFGASCS
jgi:hypothetical protein